MSDTTYTGVTNSKVTIEGGGGGGKYSLFDRVRYDNGSEIGTVGTFFTDANGVEYAVVVLDKNNRSRAQWSTTSEVVTDLPELKTSAEFLSNRDTATYNTQKILDWCNANGYTSEACNYCRNKRFKIDGTIYHGQLPNIFELFNILTNYLVIDAADTHSGSNTLASMLVDSFWSSSQNGSSRAWIISNFSLLNNSGIKTITKIWTVPVLEIPNR